MTNTLPSVGSLEAEGWSATELLEEAHLLERWALSRAAENPKLYEVVLATRSLINPLLQAIFFRSAMELSPMRSVSGPNSLMAVLGIPDNQKSKTYGFLTNALTIEHVDDFRRCKDLDAIVNISPTLSAAAENVRKLFTHYRTQIEEWQNAKK